MRVLLADGEAERALAVACEIAATPSLPVVRPRPEKSLADAVASLAPDVVPVDMARPDRDALEGIRRVAALNTRPAVMFVDEDDPGFMREAISAGVSSCSAIGMLPPDVKSILHAAVAPFRRHEQARDDLIERTVIDRARAALIKRSRLSEPDACKWLRRTAIRRGQRIVDASIEPIKTTEGNAK